jgi:putative ABC transport system permease protein
LRTALTIIAVFIGALTVSLTTGIGNGVRSYVNSQIGNIGGKNLILVSVKPDDQDFSKQVSGEPSEYKPAKANHPMEGNIKKLDDKDIEKIKNLTKAESVTPLYQVQTNYITAKNNGAKKYTINTQQDAQLDLDLAAGRLLRSSDKNSAVLPASYLKVLGFNSASSALNKNVELGYLNSAGQQQTASIKIVGVMKKTLLGTGAYVDNSLAKKIAESQSIGTLNQNGYYAAFAKYDHDLSDQEISSLKKTLSDNNYQAQSLADQLGTINNVITAITTALTVFGAIALLAASFGIVNTLLMAVNERTREIGLMKALGMNRRSVFAIFATEAVSLGFWGAILGVIASMLISIPVNNWASHSFLKGFDGLHLLAFPLVPTLIIILIIMLISFIAGALPSLKASKLDPIEALRYE